MKEELLKHSGVQSIQDIVSDAGGELVGRTRLQKIGYLLTISGFDETFDFEYKHYGPFSRKLANSIDFAKFASALSEETKATAWGGTYSIFSSEGRPDHKASAVRLRLIDIASKSESVLLELAATAAFLKAEYSDPWKETIRRKPKKATPTRVAAAKNLYSQLYRLDTPQKLPQLS